MASKRKMQYNGKEVSALSLEFETKGEPWTLYSLEDGTTIKMKVLLLDVRRIEGEYTANGNPVYQIETQYIMGIDAPDNLKKKS